jgi:succinate dehydrogenase / fumarate reductase cytochrome b subunit
MSTVAVGSGIDKANRFYASTIGKKAIVAVTGLILFGFLVVHMLGNLQIFIPDGGKSLNHYSEMLHGTPELLWGTRIVLLVSVVLHIWATIQLSSIKANARPVGYVKQGNVQASLGSRTMMLTGPVIAAFVIFHLLHFTTGTVHPNFIIGEVYHNVVSGFQYLPAVIAYVGAMLLIGTHLSHGIWSLFQSLGFSHPRYTPAIKKFAAIFSWVLVAGFIAVPLAVMAGVLK